MYKCKKCGKQFEVDWRSRNKNKKMSLTPLFCSRSCSNSRKHSNETKNKMRQSSKCSTYWISESWVVWKKEHPDYNIKRIEKQKRTFLNKLLDRDTKDISITTIRKKIRIEQNNKCAKCGIDQWNGQRIVLEIEHKDGNHQNNNRDNLEALCPNCHSQTKTWRRTKPSLMRC